jgi:hypothetical protein
LAIYRNSKLAREIYEHTLNYTAETVNPNPISHNFGHIGGQWLATFDLEMSRYDRGRGTARRTSGFGRIWDLPN